MHTATHTTERHTAKAMCTHDGRLGPHPPYERASARQTLPKRASAYYSKNLAPWVVLWVLLQLSFAAIYCAAMPVPYFEALYHVMITSTTVGLGAGLVD
jgi:hypothetical protein